MSTTGAFFVTKKVVVDGLKVRLQLWDTAGQERFRSMASSLSTSISPLKLTHDGIQAPMYYRGANAAILCYDISDASTFDDIRIWLEELKQYQRPGSAYSDEDEQPPLLIYVVGTKADLSTKKRAISLDQARQKLHTWFPPPSARPTTPPPPPPSKLSTITTITTASGLSYIRPRFTSLTSPLSAPAPPRITALSPPSPSTPPLPRGNLLRAKSTSARIVPVGTRLNEDRPAGAWKSSRPGGGMRERRWSDAMMWDEAMREREDEDADAYLQGPTTDATSDDDDYDDEWPLEKGMELFEVSAKTGKGVDLLFDSLLANIIERRDAIRREKALRERNSVMLNSPIDTNSSSSHSLKSDRAASDGLSRSGWSCCST